MDFFYYAAAAVIMLISSLLDEGLIIRGCKCSSLPTDIKLKTVSLRFSRKTQTHPEVFTCLYTRKFSWKQAICSGITFPMASFNLWTGSSARGGCSLETRQDRSTLPSGQTHRRSVIGVDRFKDPHGARVEDLLHTFQQSLSAAGQEGRKVCVDFGAYLAPLLSTLQLDTAREKKKTVLRCTTRLEFYDK